MFAVLVEAKYSQREHALASNSFSDWLNRRLRARDWSQADFARKLGVSTGSVTMWTSGKRIPAPTSIDRIADLLGADIDAVLAIAGHRPPDIDIDPDSPGEQIAALARRIEWDEGRFEGIREMFTVWINQDRRKREVS